MLQKGKEPQRPVQASHRRHKVPTHKQPQLLTRTGHPAAGRRKSGQSRRRRVDDPTAHSHFNKVGHTGTQRVTLTLIELWDPWEKSRCSFSHPTNLSWAWIRHRGPVSTVLHTPSSHSNWENTHTGLQQANA